MAFPPLSDMPAAATMKALRFHGRKDIRIDTVPVPTVGPGQVRLAPKFCGICGSDLHEYLDGPILMPTPDRPHPISKEGLPLTMGHEFAGVVQEVGEGVADVCAGDRVCVLPLMYDGDCGACARGIVNCCDNRGVVGVSGWGGGLSEGVVLPAACVKKLPDSMPLEVGALVEPLAVGWHAVDCSPFRVGDTALVLGAGPIGLAVVQALVGKGCGRIIVSEVSTRRSEFALAFGAHYAINPAKESMVARVAEITCGDMADIAYDAAGVAVAVGQAFDSLKVRATLVNIAVWGRDLPVPMNKISFREIRYTGV